MVELRVVELRASALNCSLEPSPAESSTELLTDLDIAPGLQRDIAQLLRRSGYVAADS